MAEPPNPHDRFFRHAFARPEVARGFFERYLPTDVAALLDLDTLTLAKESFVHAALEVQQSDIGENVMPTLAETWVEQGVGQGVQQGNLDHARRTLHRLLTKQFGPLPEAINARIEQADQATLDVWLDQVIGAASLEAVFHRQ